MASMSRRRTRMGHSRLFAKVKKARLICGDCRTGESKSRRGGCS